MDEESPESSRQTQSSEQPLAFRVETLKLPNVDVHLLVKTGLEKYHGDPAKPDQKSYASVATRIEEDLAWIYSRVALNEVQAIHYLVELGTKISAFLDHTRVERPSAVASVAKSHFEWPVIVTTDSNSLEIVADVRKELKLGEGIQVRPDKVKYTRADMIQLKVVYHCLVIFEGALLITSQFRANKPLQMIVDETSVRPQNATVSQPTLALLKGEMARRKKRVETIGRRSKQSKRALITLLNLPYPPNYVAPPKLEAVLGKALELPPLTAESKEHWFKQILEFLVTFSGSSLEENEKLRAVGESAGDVVVREHCKREADFPAMKIALRNNPEVNAAIQTRIKERLKKALDKFL